MNREPHILIITGTCGSGKTTVTTLLAKQQNWARVSEDDIWPRLFGKNRGAFGTEEHRRKRREVQEIVFGACLAALAEGRNVAIDATIHETPPEAFGEYREFFEARSIPWTLRVLHPRLEVAVVRDATRRTGRLGAEQVASLWAKFTGAIFPEQCFIDTSDETPEQTVRRFLDDEAA
ncbi:MAG TPA: AAA family ATPase [Thermoanaerobaculia bacterium]|nr:AAA family ATPase [Thermoanaerobaculia bacterium]